MLSFEVVLAEREFGWLIERLLEKLCRRFFESCKKWEREERG
jgi:hypothetical protein